MNLKKFRNQVCSIILAHGIRMLSNDVIVEHRYRKGKVTHEQYWSWVCTHDGGDNDRVIQDGTYAPELD